MFAEAKLASQSNRVKPEWLWQREIKSGGSEISNPGRCAGTYIPCLDLNHSNRPVRTRMPGGVGGVRSR
jgi:hypothetical protein